MKRRKKKKKLWLQGTFLVKYFTSGFWAYFLLILDHWQNVNAVCHDHWANVIAGLSSPYAYYGTMKVSLGA